MKQISRVSIKNRKNIKKNIELYNDFLATHYDRATSGEFRWLAPKKLAEIINSLPIPKKKVEILDLGVGTGQSAEVFIRRRNKITGIDISKRMLSIARSKFKFKKLIYGNIESKEGLMTLVRGAKFDIIVAIGIFEFIRNLKRVLRDIRNFLKPNGILIFTYEIFNKNNKNGVKKRNLLSSETKMKLPPAMFKFFVYRRIPKEIQVLLRDVNLHVIRRKKFVGYLKSSLKIPVLYEIVVVRQTKPF